MKMRLFAVFALVATGVTPALASVDYVEVWHACDDAAVDEGFTEASLPTEGIQGSTLLQRGGRWEGQTLHIVTAPTSTGQVFCMTDEKLRVLHYKFRGRIIIERD